jgi:WD40 repeat protein
MRAAVVSATILVLFLLILAGFALVLRGRQDAVAQPPDPLSGLALLQTLPDAGWGVEWSPDGQTLATYGNDAGLIKLWDARNDPIELLRSTEPISTPSGLKWSPDGRLLAAGNHSDGVVLLDPTTGRAVQHLSLAPPEVAAPTSPRSLPWVEVRYEAAPLGWSADSRLVTMIAYVTLRDDPLEKASPDAHQISFRVAYVWDVSTGDLVRQIPIMEDTSRSPVISGGQLSPDGYVLTVTLLQYFRDNPEALLIVKTWDVSTGRPKWADLEFKVDPETTFLMRDGNGSGAAPQWSPDGRTLSVGLGRLMMLADPVTGKVVRYMPEVVPPTYTPSAVPPPPVTTPEYYLTPPPPQSTADVPVPVYTQPPPGYVSPTPEPTRTSVPTPTADANVFGGLKGSAWSPDGRTLAAFDDEVVRFWDPATGELTRIVRYSASSLRWSPDGRYLLVGDYIPPYSMSPSSVLTLWDSAMQQQLGKASWQGVIKLASWSPTQDVLAIVPPDGGTVQIWAVRSADTQP